MRGFDCYYKFLTEDGKKEDSHASACWARVSSIITGSVPVYIPGSLKHFKGSKDPVIYIRDFDNSSTREYQKRLIELINEITPCKIVGDEIEIKLLKDYNKSLILLNFIRYLWNKPGNIFDLTLFFELLSSDKYTDPLEILTYANKEASKKIQISPGHSNAHPYDVLKIKTKKQLLKAKILNSTREFLTQD